MKPSTRIFIKDIFYSISANLLHLFVSLFVSFVVPKLLGLEQYGYWQLYTFYVGYIGFFHLGMTDGLHLRYGGKYYDELNKPLMHSQYWILAIFEIIVFFGISLIALIHINDINRTFIIIATGFNCIIILPRTMLHVLLQSTGKVKEYARNTILERSLYVVLLLIFLFMFDSKFEFMILADIIAKFAALIGISYVCKDIVFSKGVVFSIAIKETLENISTGIRLMFANIASFLIIGIVRFGIERTWDIATFGKVSFSLSISNFIIIFIFAVSLVIFPIIKRSDQTKLPQLYESFGILLSGCMMVFLVLYYPIQYILTLWLPQYIEALRYFSILFPISIFEVRSYLLITTYFKVLRLEKELLILNLLSVLLSFIVTAIVVFWLKDLYLAIFGIVFLQMYRCFHSDWFLQKKMKIKYSYDVVWNIIVSVLFIFSNWYIGSLSGWLTYILAILLIGLVRIKSFKKHFILFRTYFS